MNCLEFRRACLADPGNCTPEYVAHRRECGDCRRLAAAVEDMDAKLLRAMRIDVPEDLKARIKLLQVIGGESAQSRARPWQVALAASVLVTVVLSGLFGWQIYSAQRYVAELESAVLEHIRDEPQFLAGRAAGADQKFRQVLAAFGGEVMRDVAPVNHAEICALKNDNEPIVHTVLAGDSGAVTVIYVRGDPLAEKMPITDPEFSGYLVPAGRGNLAIVGARTVSASVDDIVQRLQQAIVWKI